MSFWLTTSIAPNRRDRDPLLHVGACGKIG